MILSPTGVLTIRGPDPIAPDGGAFGATRAKWVTKNGVRVREEYEHKGTDWVRAIWSPMYAPTDRAKIRRVGYAYMRTKTQVDPRFHVIVIEWDEWSIKYLYVWPRFLAGRILKRGEVFGFMEDLTSKYENVTPHVHTEARYQGVLVDPASIMEAA
jgi:hypothetical protein